jgi:hypothetical protein
MNSREAWKEHITAKLKSKGHAITPWLKAHIHYLSLLSPEQYRAEILKFNKENPDHATTQGLEPKDNRPEHSGDAELGAST